MTATLSGLFVDGSVVTAAGRALVYGAGSAGRDVVRTLTAAGIRVAGILDRKARPGDAFAGVPIAPLDACPIPAGDRAGIPIVIGIFNRDVDIPAVARLLRARGFAKVVSFVEFHAAFPEALGDRFWLTRRGYVDGQRQDVAAAERLFSDEQSLALYRALIALRSSGEYREALNPRPGERQYLPSDVPGWLARRPVRFVDCGAYRGDTLEGMVAANVDIEASAHFEPDIENFTMLVRAIRERHGTGATASSWPCAVSSRAHIVGFTHGLDEASRVSTSGRGSVPAVALDDVLVGWRPTFIKMDIEGSEIDGLLGARELIAAGRPSLAICVYHRPDHLWRIPLLLASWPEMAGYRYFLRTHGFDGFDTVLYANPDVPSGPSYREVRS